jgi:1-acyl-sn-glycerol-3-phosphate acyltransferase
VRRTDDAPTYGVRRDSYPFLHHPRSRARAGHPGRPPAREGRASVTPVETQRLTWRWRAITWMVVAFLRLCRWRIQVEGTEHLPRRGGAVLAFNHHSYLDYVLVAWHPVLRLRRPVRFLAKREMWASPWTGWLARWAEAVPVDRTSGTARADAYAAAVGALEAGDLVAVAPEQTISTSFELLPFRTGAVRMAQRAGVPIVPAVGWGTQRFAAKGVGVKPAFGIPVVVRYGPPLEVPVHEDPVAATQRLQERMTEMLDEVQRSYPGGTPAGAWWVPARLGGGAPSHAEVLRGHEERFRRRGPSS